MMAGREVRLPKGGEGGAVGAGADGSPPFGPSFMVGSLWGSGESLGVRKLGAGEGVTEGPELLSFIPTPGAGNIEPRPIFCQEANPDLCFLPQTTALPGSQPLAEVPA